MDELRAAVDHQLPGVVGHPHVGKRLFNHLVDGCSGDRQVVVVSRRSHRRRTTTRSDPMELLLLQLITALQQQLNKNFNIFDAFC